MDMFLKINKQNHLKPPQVVPRSRTVISSISCRSIYFVLFIQIPEWVQISEADALLQVLVLVCSIADGFLHSSWLSHQLSHLYGNPIPAAGHLKYTPEEHPAPSHPTQAALRLLSLEFSAAPLFWNTLGHSGLVTKAALRNLSEQCSL